MTERCSDSCEGWSRNVTSSAARGCLPHLGLRGGGDLPRVTELPEPGAGADPRVTGSLPRAGPHHCTHLHMCLELAA